MGSLGLVEVALRFDGWDLKQLPRGERYEHAETQVGNPLTI